MAGRTGHDNEILSIVEELREEERKTVVHIELNIFPYIAISYITLCVWYLNNWSLLGVENSDHYYFFWCIIAILIFQLNTGIWKSIKWMNKRALPTEQYQPAYIEHIANIITHAVWIFPSISAAAELYQRSENNAQVISAFVYGLTLISLFCVSTSFHCVFYCQDKRTLKDVLHRCDRGMIYIFIAGSYFPWLTIEHLPQEGLSSHMRWIIWIMAIMGILYQQIFHEKYKRLEVILYLIMGVCPVLPILSEHYFMGIVELALGGLLYVSGVFFFKCDGVIPFAHAIWHLFVALAAYAHYYAILNYLYPLINVHPNFQSSH